MSVIWFFLGVVVGMFLGAAILIAIRSGGPDG